MEKAVAETVPKKRRRAYLELEELSAKKVYQIFTVHPSTVFALSDKVRGYVDNAVIMGVCAGLADFFDTSVAVTRILALALLYFFFVPTLLLYLTLGFLLKAKPLIFRGRRGEAGFWAKRDHYTAER